MDKFFDSDSVRIRYVEQGNGEPVVLIHGFTSNVEQNWIDTSFFSELVKHYHVIALDCRGHGKSGKPHDPRQYGRQMDEDVVRLLDHLRIQKAHIVGYSMGGGITARLLTLHPERFITATLGGAAGAGLDFDRETWAAEIERGTMRSIVLALWPTGQPKPTEEQIQQMSVQVLGGNDRLALAAVLRAGFLGTTQIELASVRVPVLGVAGTADPALSRLNALNQLMPQLTVVAIQGAGHGAAFSRPEFVQAVESFLAAHPATRR